MTPTEALAFVEKEGAVLESARGPLPSLAEKVAGAPIRGSWWAHPRSNEIFLLSRAIRQSPDILVCRLVGGKVTYVHLNLWPALIRLAKRFSRKRLAAIREVHTSAGKHKILVRPFPEWVPAHILRKARSLTEAEASLTLRAKKLLDPEPS